MALSYSSYQDVPIRPLSKGMFTDLPRNGIPSGGFEDIKNMRVNEGYLETRGGLYPYFNGTVNLSADDLIAYDFDNLREKICDIVFHWKTTAQSETILISDEFIYEINNQDNINKVLLTTDELTVTATYNAPYWELVVTDGDYSDVTPGDYLRDYGSEDIYGRVVNVATATNTIYVEVDPSYTGTPSSVQCVMTFLIDSGYTVDHTVLGGYGTNEAGNEMILTDQAGRGVYRYSDGALDIYPIDSTPLGYDAYETEEEYEAAQTLKSAKAVTFFDDRLFLGNITETTGNSFPQRIWWSDALDFDRFNPTGYLDLPYSQGELLAIKPLGPNLILYFSDTIYIGRPTQMSGRPYDFQELNTNGIGLVSQKAITSYDDGHFFVGQDDVYYLSGGSGLQRVGTPVRSVTVEKTASVNMLDYVQVASDPMTESIAFIFPDTSDEIANAIGLATRIWRFYYKPQAWSYDEVPIINDQPQAYFSCVSSSRTVSRNRTYQDWYDLDGTAGDPAEQTNDYVDEWTGDDTLEAVYTNGDGHAGQEQWSEFESYDDLNSFSISAPRLMCGLYFLDSDGYFVQNVVYENSLLNQDSIGGTDYEITFRLISADYDFGVPDTDKVTRQISLRTMEHADAYFQPSVWISDGRSRLNASGYQETWFLPAPTVKYFTNYNEGRTGFLTRGSIFKFKVQFTRTTERYRLSEIVIRTKIEGAQVDL